jgi:hypothetical protein
MSSVEISLRDGKAAALRQATVKRPASRFQTVPLDGATIPIKPFRHLQQEIGLASRELYWPVTGTFAGVIPTSASSIAIRQR